MVDPRFILATFALALGACTANSQPGGARPGWHMGAYDGPMMYAGYCPGAAGEAREPGTGWYGPGMMGGGGMMRGGGMMGSPYQNTDASAWLADAKRKIGITAAQESAWAGYVDAVQADRGSMAAMHDRMRTMHQSGATAPDRLGAHAELMATRASGLAALKAATQTLYEKLTPAQRKSADEALWSGCW